MTVKIDSVEPNIFPDVKDLDARDAGRNVEVFLLSTSHSNRSLRIEVSVAGKRNFQGGDKEAETALEIQGAGAETKSRTPPIQG